MVTTTAVLDGLQQRSSLLPHHDPAPHDLIGVFHRSLECATPSKEVNGVHVPAYRASQCRFGHLCRAPFLVQDVPRRVLDQGLRVPHPRRAVIAQPRPQFARRFGTVARQVHVHEAIPRVGDGTRRVVPLQVDGLEEGPASRRVILPMEVDGTQLGEEGEVPSAVGLRRREGRRRPPLPLLHPVAILRCEPSPTRLHHVHDPARPGVRLVQRNPVDIDVSHVEVVNLVRRPRRAAQLPALRTRTRPLPEVVFSPVRRGVDAVPRLEDGSLRRRLLPRLDVHFAIRGVEFHPAADGGRRRRTPSPPLLIVVVMMILERIPILQSRAQRVDLPLQPRRHQAQSRLLDVVVCQVGALVDVFGNVLRQATIVIPPRSLLEANSVQGLVLARTVLPLLLPPPPVGVFVVVVVVVAPVGRLPPLLLAQALLVQRREALRGPGVVIGVGPCAPLIAAVAIGFGLRHGVASVVSYK